MIEPFTPQARSAEFGSLHAHLKAAVVASTALPLEMFAEESSRAIAIAQEVAAEHAMRSEMEAFTSAINRYTANLAWHYLMLDRLRRLVRAHVSRALRPQRFMAKAQRQARKRRAARVRQRCGARR